MRGCTACRDSQAELCLCAHCLLQPAHTPCVQMRWVLAWQAQPGASCKMAVYGCLPIMRRSPAWGAPCLCSSCPHEAALLLLIMLTLLGMQQSDLS